MTKATTNCKRVRSETALIKIDGEKRVRQTEFV